jgi:hypothetical protein
MKHFLDGFPPYDVLKKKMNGKVLPAYREANGHIHTPYSFSAFMDLNTVFRMAVEENISVLGINDFFVANGYNEFHKGCLKNGIFPLFNIEFIGLMKEEQEKGIRINDPHNPGRIYFSGKGLDFPFRTGLIQKLQLRSVIKETQEQVKAMIDKINNLIINDHPSLTLSYETIRKEHAHDLVRERHIAKALRIIAMENFATADEQTRFLESLYGGRKAMADMIDYTAVENEIRSNLLKSGGAAFVEEDIDSFLELKKIIKIILKSGGIPCYPVLLDDPSGNLTDFESDPERLHHSLKKMCVECIELIPARNDLNKLQEFVKFFDKRGYIITFGTEHNTPEMLPLKVTARGNTELDEYLKRTAWNGACVIAAHQYLRADGRQGYVLPDGTHHTEQRESLIELGQLVIEYYLNMYNHETGN